MYYGPVGECEEICGDGLNYGINECDDGNLESGDGCSNDCKVEPGWTCSGGSIKSKDSCQPIKTQIKALNSTDWNHLNIEFTKDVMILGELRP
jgi:cysteine-rich repeat protein